jgi:hypothetical protein
LEDKKLCTKIKKIVEESKFFIEWLAPDVGPEIQALLAVTQPELALWQYRTARRRPSVEDTARLRKNAGLCSAQLMKLSLSG